MQAQHGTIVRQIDLVFNVGTVVGLTDGELVDRFIVQRGPIADAAFAALVRRHGAMVLRVCRAILRDHHDAQDSFQATFLILARKAGSLRVENSLGPCMNRQRVCSVGPSERSRVAWRGAGSTCVFG
jgi:hypothetical protein